MHIEVTPAGVEQESILANLLELYAHDFSEFHDLEIGADGRFGYKCLPLYWSEPGRYPFLVWVKGKLAGLVLVKRGSEVSGNVMESNVTAHHFWARVISTVTRVAVHPARVEIKGKWWMIFSFESQRVTE